VTPTPARLVALELVRRVFEDGAWADRAFPAIADRAGLQGQDRAHAQRLAYGTVQRRGTCDHMIELLAGRPVGELDPPVLAALRLGLYEVLFSSRTPDHAAVDQAVELAKVDMGRGGARRASAAAGLVNAVLRRAAREAPDLIAGLDDSTPEWAAIAHSCPEWLARMWWRELGQDDARALLRAANEPSESAFRVNTLRADPELVRAELAAAGEEVEGPAGSGPLAPRDALVVRGPLSAGLRRRLDAGELVAQARASQAVVGVLAAASGERVLDLCAGPGIKTTGIVAGADGAADVVAVEIDPERARQLVELCRRLGAARVDVRRADAAGDDLGGGYDRVLVDPPCSDLGTLASRPDVRWRKSPETVEGLAGVQAAIARRGAAALRPGGTMVYSTCTISERENEGVVAALLEECPELHADDLGSAHPALASTRDARFLQTRPDRDGTDGFFIARLRRSEG
jgi:16S rRNA (cytosine967-C5)-methyltransferase